MTVSIDQERLWNTLQLHAAIGATDEGGVNREALTEADKLGRDQFVEWCKDAGLQVEIDSLGSIYATRAGIDNSLHPIAMGSHLDTQPTGGKYDGILGVLGGLEVVRSLNDANITTMRPIQIVDWTNEEGSRFVPSMGASGVYAGIFEEDDILAERDRDGISFAEALSSIGYKGPAAVGKQEFHAFIELHIEQGPVLENRDMEIGLVTGSQAMNWSHVTVTGCPAHAGTTPMENRTDALAATTRLLDQFYKMANSIEDARATVGVLNAFPGSHSTIPNRVEFTLDLRHPDENTLTALIESFDEWASEEEQRGFGVARSEFGVASAQIFDEHCTAIIRDAARDAGYRHCDIVSGAGHDAVYINHVCPTGMIFVPCEDGISHNPAESITPEQAAAGVDVLFRTVVSLANENNQR